MIIRPLGTKTPTAVGGVGMDRKLVCLIVAGSLGTGAAQAAPTNDCRNFDRGTEIVGNIAKRYYQPNTDDTALLFKILKGIQADAEQAKILEQGALEALGEPKEPPVSPGTQSSGPDTAGPADEGRRRRRNRLRGDSSEDSPESTENRPATSTTDGCAGRKAKLRELIGQLEIEIQASKDAQKKCEISIRTPNFADRAQECYEAAVKVMDLDYKIGLDEDGATVAPKDGTLIRFMDSLGRDGCRDESTWPVQLNVHALIAPRPCAREGSYCYMTRIGKLREARGHLRSVAGEPLTSIAAGVDRPLLGEAEHRFWYLRDHLETDNRKVLEGILMLSKAYTELEKGLRLCSR